jgi:hemolysin activation/secretion protein
VQYGANWQGERSLSQLGATLTLNVRGLGSNALQFDAKRYDATGRFLHLRLEASRTEPLPGGLELTARAHGQYSPDPLVSSEQFIAGGADSVRGYTESQAAGDYGATGSLEVRSPSLANLLDRGGSVLNDWRLRAFAEGGWMSLQDPLPEQQSIFRLWSVGAGASARIAEHWNAAMDLGVPLRSEGTAAHQVRFHFRIWAEM